MESPHRAPGGLETNLYEFRLQVTMGTFMLLVGFGFLLEQIWYKSVMACVTIQCTVMRATVMIVPLDTFHRDSPRNAFLTP